jgi:hypothetical protein
MILLLTTILDELVEMLSAYKKLFSTVILEEVVRVVVPSI